MRAARWFQVHVLIVMGILCLPLRGGASLVSQWKLDEGTGTAVADAVGANHGSMVGAPSWTDGILGSALVFRGSNFTDSVQVANAASLNPSSLTVSAWVRTIATNPTMGVVDKVTGGATISGYHLDVGNSGAGWQRFGTKNGATSPTVTNKSSLADGTWHLMTGIFADTGAVKSVRYYLDGILKASTTTNTSIKADPNAFFIAGDGAATLRFIGAIDDVALWNHPLRDAEVRGLHGLALAGGLKYHAGQAQMLYDLFEAAGPGSNTVVANRRWSYVTGMTGAEGALLHSNGYYELRLDTAGNGLRSPGMLSRWAFDEGSGQTASDSAFINPGTLGTNSGVDLSDPAWTVNGKFGGALSFDGASNNRVVVANSSSLNPASITVSAWVRTSDTGASRGIVDKVTSTPSFSGYWLDIGNVGAGRPRFGIRYGTAGANTVTAAGPASVADDTWHLLTGVYADTGAVKTISLYVDGVLQSSATTNVSITPDPNSISIGGDGASTLYLTGLIDDVGLWDRPLSAAEAKAVHALATHPALGYDLAKVDALLGLFQDKAGSVTINGTNWYYVAAGLPKGDEGQVRGWEDGKYSVNLGGGEGVAMFRFVPTGSVFTIAGLLSGLSCLLWVKG